MTGLLVEQPATFVLSPDILREWLEWAGGKLIAMSGARSGPTGYKTCWPDYDQDKFEVLQFRRGDPIRVSPPTSAEITLTEEILRLPNLCSDKTRRRILHARALTHPVSGRNLTSWRRLAEILGRSEQTVKSLHTKALEEVVRRVPSATVYQIQIKYDLMFEKSRLIL